MTRRNNRYCCIDGCINFLGTKSNEFNFFRYGAKNSRKYQYNFSSMFRFFRSLFPLFKAYQMTIESRVNGWSKLLNTKSYRILHVIHPCAIFTLHPTVSLIKENSPLLHDLQFFQQKICEFCSVSVFLYYHFSYSTSLI